MNLKSLGKAAGLFLLLFVSGLALEEHQHHESTLNLDEESSETVELWPFDKNKTAKNDTNNYCSTQTSCDECSSSSLCHWCAHDKACHAIGSVHGCLVGASCNNNEKNDTAKNNTDNSGCMTHTNCRECAISSHLCHWCAHDNACHAVASVYGCVTGVDCYSNDRCKRKEPEPLHQVTFTKMGAIPMLGFITFGAILACCASLCFCVASGVKGAYDDLALIAADRDYQEPLLSNPRTEPLAEPLVEDMEEAGAESPDDVNDSVHLERSEEGIADGDALETANDNEHDLTTPLISSQRDVQARRPVHMQRLYNACAACYLVTLVAIACFVFGGIRYFPKVPIYNICNDNVAWKSLIDSMASMKVSADFEILASLSNPNHFDVALDMGKGSFTHDGVFVGSFEIPPVTAKAMSITDLMIITTFTPEKWEALSITSEYYHGRLVLTVDAQASIRVPALFDYSFHADMKGLVVHVSELSDRSLCACPTWDERNTTRTMFEL